MRPKTPGPAGRRLFLRGAAAAGVAAAVPTNVAEAQQPARQPSERMPPLSQLRLIDLSVALEHDAAGERTKPKIEYVTHRGGGLQSMMTTFGAKPEDFVYSNGHGWAVENLVVGSHTATHIDAPYHYGAISEGRPSKRIDEVPLEWCFGPGVLLDMRHRQPGEVITVGDLQTKLKEIGHRLAPGDIVLIHTGAATRWGTADYFRQPGLDRESTLWLVNQGIRMIGIDAWTLDREFAAQIEDFKRTGDGRHIWPAHFAGLTKEYCQIEKLANLESLPRPHGFFVSCLPVKIKGGSAGWCRAIALVPEANGGAPAASGAIPAAPPPAARDAALEAVVASYAAAWGEPDPAKRLRLLEQSFAADGTYTDPTAHIVGRTALGDHIGTVLRRSPGASIQPTSVADSHHGTLRFNWRMTTASGSVMAEGLDFGELAQDGKLRRIVGFFGPLAPR